MATTGPATDVGLTGATLNGSVEDAQSAYFEYGTSTAYGLMKATQSDGDVSATIEDLTVNTTYHYRLVAIEPDGITKVYGTDKTFRTGGPPLVSDQRARDVRSDSANLTASVNPNGADTTYVIEWGRSTGYGNRTAATVVGSGRTAVAVTARLTGLRPYTRYHWRTVATNAAGVTRGRNRSFRTLRRPSSVSIGLSRRTVPWGGSTRIGGRASGAGVAGMPLVLQHQRFPLDQGFTQVDTTRTGGDGGYLFTIPELWTTTRYRVVTQTQVSVTSPVVTARSAVEVGARARHRTRMRAWVEGSVLPGVHGTASLQRYRRGRGWRQVKAKTVAPASELHSRYRFGVRRPGRRAAPYRLRVVMAPVRRAHVRGKSRTVLVRPRPR
jgi:hypothetical protein